MPEIPGSGLKKKPNTPCETVGMLRTSVRVSRSRIEKAEVTASLMTATAAKDESEATSMRNGCVPVIGIVAATVRVVKSMTVTSSERTLGVRAYRPSGVTATSTGKSPVATVSVIVREATSKNVTASVSRFAIAQAVPFGRNAISRGMSPSGSWFMLEKAEARGETPAREDPLPSRSTRRGASKRTTAGDSTPSVEVVSTSTAVSTRGAWATAGRGWTPPTTAKTTATRAASPPRQGGTSRFRNSIGDLLTPSDEPVGEQGKGWPEPTLLDREAPGLPAPREAPFYSFGPPPCETEGPVIAGNPSRPIFSENSGRAAGTLLLEWDPSGPPGQDPS